MSSTYVCCVFDQTLYIYVAQLPYKPALDILSGHGIAEV